MNVYADSVEQLAAWVLWYQSQGFGLRWYQPTAAVLVRRKRLSAGWLIFWLLVGWLLVWIPLVIYLVLHAVAADETITVRLAQTNSTERVDPEEVGNG